MKTNQLIAAAGIMLFVNVPNSATAFDVHTHTAMTHEAVKKSQLGASPNASGIIKKLGIFDRPDIFGERYLDIGVTVTSRDGKQFEADIMNRVRTLGQLPLPLNYSLPGWIIRGAVREDDNTSEVKPNTPEADEPGGVFNRVFGHFYDPQNNRALTLTLPFRVLGPTSPDWALKNDATIPVTPVLNAIAGQNHFNIPSGREAMWRALTGKTWANNTVGGDVPITASAADYPTLNERKYADRKAYWATTFRAVGDVMHLVQDLAQPQHTRNDAHSGAGCVALGTPFAACAGGHASFFESYLKARTLRGDTFTLEEGLTGNPTSAAKYTISKPDKLVFDTYDVPQFANLEIPL
jgi:hypothetical protein